MKLSGEVKAGKLICRPAEWAIAMRQYEGHRVIVDIEPERQLRSLRANARYWSLLVPLAGDFLSKTRDVPLSKEQVHFVLASSFLGCDETPLGLAPMPTRRLDTKQFAGYCERITAWLGDNGYAVPDSSSVDIPEVADLQYPEAL